MKVSEAEREKRRKNASDGDILARRCLLHVNTNTLRKKLNVDTEL
jgi:hypothetical protein